MLKSKYEKFYIIPTIITYFNLILGILAIFISNQSSLENLKLASYLLIVAAIMDKLDGYIARRLHMTSEFGKQLDSLSDMVSFGIAPMLLTWNLGLKSLGPLGIIIICIYMGSGAFRLARFNIDIDNIYIKGLPITISGLFISLKIIFDISFRINTLIGKSLIYENTFLVIILSLLMLGSFKIKKPF